jgi:hypothetical protein
MRHLIHVLRMNVGNKTEKGNITSCQILYSLQLQKFPLSSMELSKHVLF